MPAAAELDGLTARKTAATVALAGSTPASAARAAVALGALIFAIRLPPQLLPGYCGQATWAFAARSLGENVGPSCDARPSQRGWPVKPVSLAGI
jgi:hypothetical protein